MRAAVAAVLLALLPACAAPGEAPGEHAVPTRSAEPVLVARSGPDTLRFVDRRLHGGLAVGGILTDSNWSLRFAFDSTERDSLVTNKSEVVLRAGAEWRTMAERTRRRSDPGRETEFTVAVDEPPFPSGARDMEVDLVVFRVLEWKHFEAPGLMDASLDEIHCPPFLLRFAGEGESCWLSVSMADAPKHPLSGMDPADVVTYDWVAQSATLTDAKGRVLVRNVPEGDGIDTSVQDLDSRTESFSTHAKDAPPPPGEPTIQYPVTVRLRVPAKWTSEVRKFRFRGLPSE